MRGHVPETRTAHEKSRLALEDVSLYPIRTAAQLVGVDARRIRSWETKYGLLSPMRTRGGHRLFSRRELELIRRIKRMVDEEGLSLQGIRLLLQAEREGRRPRKVDGE